MDMSSSRDLDYLLHAYVHFPLCLAGGYVCTENDNNNATFIFNLETKTFTEIGDAPRGFFSSAVVPMQDGDKVIIAGTCVKIAAKISL